MSPTRSSARSRAETPSTRPSSPTRSGSRCSACSRRSARRSGSPSFCTTSFSVPFEQVADLIDRSPAAARKAASRARMRVEAEPTEPDVDLDRQREVVEAFFAAAREGDFDALVDGPRPGSRHPRRRRRGPSFGQPCDPRRRRGRRPGDDLRETRSLRPSRPRQRRRRRDRRSRGPGVLGDGLHRRRRQGRRNRCPRRPGSARRLDLGAVAT